MAMNNWSAMSENLGLTRENKFMVSDRKKCSINRGTVYGILNIERKWNQLESFENLFATS